MSVRYQFKLSSDDIKTIRKVRSEDLEFIRLFPYFFHVGYRIRSKSFYLTRDDLILLIDKLNESYDSLSDLLNSNTVFFKRREELIDSMRIIDNIVNTLNSLYPF